MFKIVDLQDVVFRAKKLAEDKLAKGENADEFVEIAEADDSKFMLQQGKLSKILLAILFMRIQEMFSCLCSREK